MPRAIPEFVCNRVIELHLNGYSANEIASELQINYRTAQKWIQRYEDDGATNCYYDRCKGNECLNESSKLYILPKSYEDPFSLALRLGLNEDYTAPFKQLTQLVQTVG